MLTFNGGAEQNDSVFDYSVGVLESLPLGVLLHHENAQDSTKMGNSHNSAGDTQFLPPWIEPHRRLRIHMGNAYYLPPARVFIINQPYSGDEQRKDGWETVSSWNRLKGKKEEPTNLRAEIREQCSDDPNFRIAKLHNENPAYRVNSNQDSPKVYMENSLAIVACCLLKNGIIACHSNVSNPIDVGRQFCVVAFGNECLIRNTDLGKIFTMQRDQSINSCFNLVTQHHHHRNKMNSDNHCGPLND
jgi:hypothetical protein